MKFSICLLTVFLICINVLFSQTDNNPKINSISDEDKTNDVNFRVHLPILSTFHFKTDVQSENKINFLGLGFGLEYYISNDISINADFAVTPFLNPDNLGGIESGDIYEKTSSIFTDLQIGTDYKGIHFDAGVHLWRVTYEKLEKDAAENQLGEKYNVLLSEYRQLYAGPAFSAHYEIYSILNVGLNYYLSLVKWWERDKDMIWQYNHSIFLELMLKF